MFVNLFLLADYATIDQAGKLSVLGIFNQVHAHEYPVKHEMMYLVIRIGVELGEQNDTRSLAVKFLDQDGAE